MSGKRVTRSAAGRTPRPRAVEAAHAANAAADGERAQEARVHGAILEAVMSHQLPPGTRLVEMPLCEAFNVSRSLLRRVLVRLANEKVIELHHNRGATVAQASPQETRDVFEARRLIETALLRSLPPPDKRGVDVLRALVDSEEGAHEQREWSRLIRLSGEFHLQLAAAFGNAELTSVLRGLVARTSLMIALYEMPGRGACSFDEHRVILAAMAKGDMAAAARHMGQHLENCELKLRVQPEPLEIDFSRLFGAGSTGKPRRPRTLTPTPPKPPVPRRARAAAPLPARRAAPVTWRKTR
jgi:DNA-binding GntR family transcriptional regulator